jgi:UDP-N-acetyl-D-glucosamine dehydrogenase
MRQHSFSLQNTALNPKTTAQFDLILLATDHDYIDYGALLQDAKIIVDCRGRYRNYKSNKIIMA